MTFPQRLKDLGYTEEELDKDNPYNEKEMNMIPQELESDLRQFTGTTNYYAYSPLFKKVVLTDGAKFLAEEAKAYWLMDAIASHLPGYDDTFAVVKLQKREKDWLLTLDDGNDNIFAEQVIEYSDFPLDEIMLYVGRQDMETCDLWVIMLTSEW